MSSSEGDAKRVRLAWTGEGLSFEGSASAGTSIRLDGHAEAGPSPTEALLLSLAGCMAIDILHILTRSRVPVTELTADVEGIRAEKPPRRFQDIEIVFTVTGPAEEHEPRMERALALSESTYCSVLHSLRSDIRFDLSIRRG